jgi:lipopolysaccharide export system protein LptA
MRGTRWLLLVAIVAIICGVSLTYRAQKRAIKLNALTKPQALPENLNFVGDGTTWSEKASDRACEKYFISADSNRQSKDSSRVDMRGVTLKLFNKACTSYNLVTTAEASFFNNEKRFYSQGDVQITLSVPMEGKPTHELVSIKSAGVTLNTDTGRAETDQPAAFTFENGDGTATGAYYDPDTHELQLKKDVVVHRHPPGIKPMIIEAGNLIYHELTGEVLLSPWGKLTRENTIVEGENPVIKLRDREYIQEVHATKAHGTDLYSNPDTHTNRNLNYAADDLLMGFDDKGEVQKMTGDGNARVVETSESSETTVTGRHVEMLFNVQVDGEHKESQLDSVVASGQAVAASKPLPMPGHELTETHILKSETIEMKMRPGGKDLQTVISRNPGTLEFLPNTPLQHHRILSGKDMVIAYGAQNRIDTFHAIDVKTLTDPNVEEKKKDRAVSNTSSHEISARFEPGTSNIASMEQKGAFVYDEGERHARADEATLDQKQNVIVLKTGARMWDASGTTTADRIRMNQSTGDFIADGNVNSNRLPEKDPKKNSKMLDSDEPLQAQAQHMESTNHNQTVHYQGKAQMWQGADRIQADKIDLDREKAHPEKHALIADGSVVSALWQQPKDEEKKKGAVPILTTVLAPHMVYTDENRLAIYSGGVQMTRPNMKVKCQDLHAYLADSSADSRLEKAYADGTVEIIQVAPDRTRTGTAEHAEYFTADQKVILRGGHPQMLDSLGGSQNAPELIYTADDGSLQSNGTVSDPAKSRIVRRHKK